jgi:hypothetical protein
MLLWGRTWNCRFGNWGNCCSGDRFRSRFGGHGNDLASGLQMGKWAFTDDHLAEVRCEGNGLNKRGSNKYIQCGKTTSRREN